MSAIELDVAYGPKTRHRLDMYFNASKSTSTLVVFWHGGSWKSGDKSIYHFVGRSLAKLGYTTALPNYQLYPAVHFPDFIEDAALAVKWLQEAYRPDRLILMGHSAGAHIAAVLALDEQYLRAAGVNTTSIKGFIGLSGPYDFNPRPDLRPVFHGHPRITWNPVNLVNRPQLPMLLIQGGLDFVVYPANARALAKAVRQTGGKAKLRLIPLAEHMAVLLAFLPGFTWFGGIQRAIKAFIEVDASI